MAVKPIPDGYHTVTPYLIVDEGEKLLEFMKRAFGATVNHVTRRPDGAIWHADVTIGDSHVMMGQANEQWTARPCAINLYVPDIDATYRQAMGAGGVSLGEPTDQFYGDRSGGVQDPCGNYWWISTHIEDVSPEEMKRREQAMAKQQA